MEIWERKAARAVNAARSLVHEARDDLKHSGDSGEGHQARIGELDELLDILAQASCHIDPHQVVTWEYQTPLPF